MNPILIQAINLAIQLLSHRIFAFVCLFLTSFAFGWCLYDPTVLRIVSATIFGVMCFMYQRKDAEKPKEVNDV